jgi:hypothetical protein
MTAAFTNGDRVWALPANQEDHDRAARNQGLSQDANARIIALPNRPAAVFELFICECSLDGCADTISLSVNEYEGVRRHPARFAVVPGHIRPTLERVVEAVPGRYEVVERIERNSAA